MSKVKVDDFYEAATNILDDYVDATREEVKEAVKEVSKESASIVKDHVPSNWSSDYKNQIKASSPKISGGAYVSWVHMNGDKYRLAHLLEYGHATVKKLNNNTKQRANAYPHFKYGADYANDTLPDRIKEKLK